MGSRYKIMADKIGISSACFYPLDTIESLRQCVKGGFTSAEIFINTYSEMSGEYYKEMKAYIDGAGLEIVSIHPFTSGYENVIFFTGYDRRIEDGIEFYKTYFDFAARLGAKFVVFHGNNMKTKFCGFEKYAEIFTRINECAHTFGVELIHENTTWCVAREAAGITELRRACPDMKFVFDAKQSCRGRADPSPANGFVYRAAVICGRADPSPTNGFVYYTAELYGRADPSPTSGFVYRAAVFRGSAQRSHTFLHIVYIILLTYF